MRYQITVKQYKGSVPVKKECWELMKDSEKQWKNMQEFPMRVRCIRKEEGRRLSFFIQAEMIGELDEPVSLALDTIKEEWERKEYVFFPAAVYNGNCLESVRLPYPPYHEGRTKEGWQQVITDIPHIDRSKEESGIQLRSGDMSTPAMGYYSEKRQEGMLFLAKHRIHGEYTGFCVREKGDEAWFSVSLPAVREKNKYFFGELPDGTGFFPTMEYPSDDEGILLKKGERLEMEIQIFRIQAENIQKYMEGFNEVRENLETGTEFCSIPFSKAYHAVKEKYKKMNFAEEGYYRVGTENEVPPCFWQAGWVGGGMNTLSFLVEDQDLAGQQARSTLRFIVEKLQRENGWYIPMYAKGIAYGDDFRDGERSVLLVRKDADLLYFLLKQAFILREKQETIEGLSESIRRQADAKLFLDKGADAILIADDMAFNSGVFLPPYVMEENVYPFYKQMVREIKAYKNVPVFLHSDGNLNSVMDELVKCGFDGIQSLQPSAGMDIREIKEKYGDRLCLWGNIDLDHIMCFGTEEEVKEDVRRTIEISSPGGGFILSTCNTMVDIIPPKNIFAMIEEAEKH